MRRGTAVTMLVLALSTGACGSIGGLGGLPVVRDQADPIAAALDEVDGCPVLGDVVVELPDPAVIDAAIEAAGNVRGPGTVGGIPFVWGTVDVAAFEFGGSALFLGRDGTAWLRMAPGRAVLMRTMTTPAGREIWWLEDTAAADACP